MNAFTGEVRPFLFAPPSDWVICDGSVLNISSYPKLSAVIGAAFGGDGTTTFAVPNMQGCIPFGSGLADDGRTCVLGQSGGSESKTLTADNLPEHTHTASFEPTGATALGVTIAVANASATETPRLGNYLAQSIAFIETYAAVGSTPIANNFLGPIASASTPAAGIVTLAATGSGTAFETIPASLAMAYYICIDGATP